MTIIELGGCRTRPIGSYLKALGVLRLVGEQLDPSAAGSWVGDSFRLETAADSAALVAFFVNKYSPTPIVAPWNKASGLWPVAGSKDKSARLAVSTILGTTTDRFDDYRDAIKVAQRTVAQAGWEATGDKAKQRQASLCRAVLPDRAVKWLDASVVISNDGAVFPPLLGSGGNDGVLEFSSNFMQRLAELLIDPPKVDAPTVEALLENALFGNDSRLLETKLGQFDSASRDSKATSASGADTDLANPWDFVLALEGALLFASSVARRFGTHGNSQAAIPFAVRASPHGPPGSTSGEDEKQDREIWAPIWCRPAGGDEIAHLIGEGRAQWGRDQAGNGVDFAKAVATLGVDRGIDRFVRHGMAKRNGKAHISVALGEVTVGSRPEARVLLQVDHWLQRLKRPLPAATASARRRVEAAEYRAATQSTGRPAALLQQVLVELADLELAIARSSDRCEMPYPVGGGRTALPADDWLPSIDDGTPELRIAAALASARDIFGAGELERHTRTTSSLALSFRPVQLGARGRIEWAPGPPRIGGIQRRPIQDLLADALVDREVRLSQRGASDGQSHGSGVDLWFDTGLQIPQGDLLDLAEGRVDLDRLGDLFRGLLLLNWRRRVGDASHRYQLVRPSGDDAWKQRTSPAMATLLPFFHGEEVIAHRADGTDTTIRPRPQSGWARQLAIGRVNAVLDDAVHRLRIAGLRPSVEHVRPTPAEADGALVVAALCRTSTSAVNQFIRQTCPCDSQINESARQSHATIKEQP